MAHPDADFDYARSRLLHAEAVAMLADAGIDCLVIKGPTVADWLYGNPHDRPVGDVDLLIRGADREAAEAALAVRYARLVPGLRKSEWNDRAVVFYRRGDGRDQQLDLHTNFHGVGADGDELWNALWAHRETVLLGGRECWMPGLAGRTLLVVLHSAQDRHARPKTLEDLRRCLESAPHQVLETARQLAEDLDALPAFAVGLRADPTGSRLADDLHLSESSDPIWRLKATGASPMAVRLAEIRTMPWRDRLRVILSEIWPSRASIEYQRPMAQRAGPAWRLIARLVRLARIVGALPRAVHEQVTNGSGKPTD